MVDSDAPLAGNPNRKDGGMGEDGDWVSGIDAALGALSVGSGTGAERHPEKRLKAVSKRTTRRRRPGRDTLFAVLTLRGSVHALSRV